MKPSREAGFTLPELLVAISILGIIVAVLGQALNVGFKTTAAAGTMLIDAGDVQLLSSHLLTDVKGADAIGTSGGPPCEPDTSSAPVPARVLWTQTAAVAGTQRVAAYFVTHVPADAAAGTTDRSELRRLACEIDDATGASTPAPGEGTPVARWPGLGGDPLISCDGRRRSGGQTTLRTVLTADGTELALVDASGFPAPGTAYPILVGGEPMTVTGGGADGSLTVTRTAATPSEHAAGATVTWGRKLLAAELPDTATSVPLTDVAGFPTTGPPYPLVVGGETMTVTGGFGTTALEVSRPSPVTHVAGEAVTYPTCGARTTLTEDRDASDTTLTLGDATGFPTSGPDHPIDIEGETMTVTGGFGTTDLEVARTSGVPHAANAAVTWTPALVTIRLPATGFSLSVSRRAT